MDRRMNEEMLERDLDGVTIHTYDERRLPITGIGPDHLPFLDMEPYLDTSKFAEFHDEVNLALSQIWDYNFPNVNGIVPKELRWFEEQTQPLHMLYHIEYYDPTGRHRANLAKLETKAEKIKYCTFAMGAVQPWYFSLFLLYNEYITRQEESLRKFGEHAELFPQIIDYFLNHLPFKYVSRAILFATFPGAEVICHRDIIQTGENLDHHFCFNFGKGRRAYVYDCNTREKVFVRDECRAYMFNDRDYHGVEAVPYFTYTIRVDGQFTDEFCKTLGFVGGRVA